MTFSPKHSVIFSELLRYRLRVPEAARPGRRSWWDCPSSGCGVGVSGDVTSSVNSEVWPLGRYRLLCTHLRSSSSEGGTTSWVALRTTAGSCRTRVSLLGQRGVRVLLVVSEEPAVALQPLLVNHLISFFEPDILGPHIPNGGKR